MNSRSSRIVAMAIQISKNGEEAQRNNDIDINAENKENIDSNNAVSLNQEGFYIPLHEAIDHNAKAEQTCTESKNALEHLLLQPFSEVIFQHNIPRSNDANEELMYYESSCSDNFSDKNPNYRISDESFGSSSFDSSSSDSDSNCLSLTFTEGTSTKEVNNIAIEPIPNLQNDEALTLIEGTPTEEVNNDIAIEPIYKMMKPIKHPPR